MKRALCLFLVAALLLSGCAFFKAVGRVLAVGAGGAAGAAVGGPAGAGAGAGLTYVALENSELRSGSLQGDDARDAQIDELKSMVLVLSGEKTATELAFGGMAGGKDWAVKWLKRAGWAIGLMVVFWFLARKRYIKRTITGDGAGSRPWMLVHAVFGWDWTRRLAFGYEPLKITKKNLIGAKAVR